MKSEKRSKSSSSIIGLPDEVVMEILKWVPVTDLMKHRRVCRRWRDLISTQYFKDVHVKSCTPPMVLVYIRAWRPKISELLLLQNIWDTKRKRLTIPKLDKRLALSSPLIFTYGSLVVFHDDDNTSYGDFIFNPIYRDKFIISRPMDSGFTVFGMFFSTLMKEYCVLWGSFKKGNVQFKMLTLGFQQSFRDLKPPNLFIKKPHFPPVVIDDTTLYWLLRLDDLNGNYVSCEEVIMAFETKNEEFILMPHPGSTKYCRAFDHIDMHIVKIGGCLSFVRLRSDESFIVKIWTLKDSANRIWVKTHRVCFAIWDGIPFIHVEVLAFENGELLLHGRFGTREERLYACNLNQGTVRKIGSAYLNANRICMYVPSFASPLNGRQNTEI